MMKILGMTTKEFINYKERVVQDMYPLVIAFLAVAVPLMTFPIVNFLYSR